MMDACRTCQHWHPGERYPSYDTRGTCDTVHATAFPTDRPALIHPAGNAWLETSANFGCTEHRARP